MPINFHRSTVRENAKIEVKFQPAKQSTVIWAAQSESETESIRAKINLDDLFDDGIEGKKHSENELW